MHLEACLTSGRSLLSILIGSSLSSLTLAQASRDSICFQFYVFLCCWGVQHVGCGFHCCVQIPMMLKILMAVYFLVWYFPFEAAFCNLNLSENEKKYKKNGCINPLAKKRVLRFWWASFMEANLTWPSLATELTEVCNHAFVQLHSRWSFIKPNFIGQQIPSLQITFWFPYKVHFPCSCSEPQICFQPRLSILSRIAYNSTQKTFIDRRSRVKT